MTSRPWGWLVVVVACACASSPPRPRSPADDQAGPEALASPRTLPATSAVPLAGARCQGHHGSCRCRVPGDDAESEPPPEGKKRLEIRLAADGGSAALHG